MLRYGRRRFDEILLLDPSSFARSLSGEDSSARLGGDAGHVHDIAKEQCGGERRITVEMSRPAKPSPFEMAELAGSAPATGYSARGAPKVAASRLCVTLLDRLSLEGPLAAVPGGRWPIHLECWIAMLSALETRRAGPQPLAGLDLWPSRHRRKPGWLKPWLQCSASEERGLTRQIVVCAELGERMLEEMLDPL